MMQPLATNQAWQHRREVMIRAIQSFPGPIKALEIGTWFAEGSTALWLEHLKPGSSLTLVDAWRPYASPSDVQASDGYWNAMDGATTDAFLSAYLTCRRHEISAVDRQIDIHLVRAPSSQFLPMLADETFDFIYIDGDHKYPSATADMAQAKRLIRKTGYGMICGDDLEMIPTPELIALARRHLDRDYVEGFHPGVLLAVVEHFHTISMHNGFWFTLVRDGVFGVQ
jgi:hypothetical protein